MKPPASDRQSEARDVDRLLRGSVESWLASVGGRSRELGRLLGAPAEEQDRLGYRHTLREIGQQPLTWLETTEGALARLDVVAAALAHVHGERRGTIVFTGSGSSLYAGECLSPALQESLRIPVHAVAAGEVLTHPAGWLPPSGPCLVVSLARSGNSPESCAVLDTLHDTAADRHNLVITC